MLLQQLLKHDSVVAFRVACGEHERDGSLGGELEEAIERRIAGELVPVPAPELFPTLRDMGEPPAQVVAGRDTGNPIADTRRVP